MKIVNLCLAGSYNVGWGYQDNLISKYQAKNGNTVTIITSQFVNDKNSEGYLKVKSGCYEDCGVKVIRLKNGLSDQFTKLFRHYKGLYKALNNEKPDFIFIHCLQFVDILYVCKYLKKHPNVKCCVDNHADYTNSAQSKFAYFVHKTLWRFCARRINKYADVFYGVLPLRCDFLYDMYGIDNNKIKLLVMGADDKLLEKGLDNRKNTRKQYGFKEDDFVILTGGKIDYHKTETLTLMDVANDLDRDNVKLLVFGSVANELKEDFKKKLSNKVIYAGWLNQEDIYNIIGSCDLGFFPGRHSVIWEQMVASGTPCVFKKIEKTNHVDIGGNCLFLDDNSYDGIKKMLDHVLKDDNYNEMKKCASSDERKNFLYSKIAEASVNI